MVKKFIIAVDLGGTNLKIGLLNSRYGFIERKVIDMQRLKGKEALISTIVDSVKAISLRNKLKKENILGIGLGFPGPIDNLKGVVHFLPNIPGWKEVRVSSILKKKLGVPVFLDNDVNLMCLAEHKLGAAAGARNAVCLTLGTGVGGGLIIDGKLYRGQDNASGEIGHIPINETGPACSCGGIACLERYIGNSAIIAEARKLFHRYVSPEELSGLAQKNNKKALLLWSKIAKHLATALVGVINLLNPDCIVIGGGIAGAGRFLFDDVKIIIRKKAMSVQAKRAKIFKAKLGNNAGLIGAAILVQENSRS